MRRHKPGRELGDVHPGSVELLRLVANCPENAITLKTVTVTAVRPAGSGERISQMMKLFSVDDHIVEPAHLWTSRLPRKLVERGPHIVRPVTYNCGSTRIHEYRSMARWQLSDVRERN